MQQKAFRYLGFPFVLMIAFYFFFRQELSFFQSPTEAPIYIAVMFAVYALFCAGLDFGLNFASRFIFFRGHLKDQIYWGSATFPFVILVGISLLALTIGEQKGPHAADKVALELCRALPQLRSPASTIADAAIYFSNQSKAPVQVMWVNYEGSQIKYNVLQPGQKYEQKSRIGHLWTMLDQSGKCLGTYAVTEVTNQALIR